MDVNLCASSCHGGKFCVPTDQREMPFGNGGFERSVPCQVQSKQCGSSARWPVLKIRF